MTSISIVLIDFQRADNLISCARTLSDHVTRHETEVVVVEFDTPSEALAQVMDLHPRAVVIPASRFGVAAMRNLGLRSATGDLVVFLDTDTELQAGALDEIADVFERRTRVGVVAAKLLNPDGTLQYSVRRFYTLASLLLRRVPTRWAERSRSVRRHLMADWDHADERPVDWVVGACFAVDARVARQLGGFSEDSTFGFEDVDFCFRCWRQGWQVWYAPRAVVVHDYVRSSSGLNRRTASHALAALRFGIRAIRLRATMPSSSAADLVTSTGRTNPDNRP